MASFRKTGGAGEEGQGQKPNGTKGESGTSAGDGVATNKKRDLSDRVLVLGTTMNEELTNVEGRLKDIRTDLQAGRNETYLIIKIFLWGVVAVCGTVVGGVLFKLLYLDTCDKRQAQADL
ncbi:hypothetical protein HOY82DRAFT_618257 [Tuber indicum]|nr:hypothetical protein HOY82DRAFT_618257 [Tuber indicum]